MPFDLLVSNNKSSQIQSLCLNTISLIFSLIALSILTYHFICQKRKDSRLSQLPKALKVSAITFCVSGLCITIIKIIISSFVLFYPVKYIDTAEGKLLYNPVYEDVKTERIINVFTIFFVLLLFASLYLFILLRLKGSFAGSAYEVKKAYLCILYLFLIISVLSISSFLVIQHIDLLEQINDNNREIVCTTSSTNECQNQQLKCDDTLNSCIVLCNEVNSCESMKLYSNALETVIVCSANNSCNGIDVYCGHNQNDITMNICNIECVDTNSCNNITLHCNDDISTNHIDLCSIAGEVSQSIQSGQIYCNLGNEDDVPCLCEGRSCDAVDVYSFGNVVLSQLSEEQEGGEEEEEKEEEEDEDEDDHGFLICLSEKACFLEKVMLCIFFVFDAMIRICVVYSFNSKLWTLMHKLDNNGIVNENMLRVIIQQTLLLTIIVIVNTFDLCFNVLYNGGNNNLYQEYLECVAYNIQIVCFLLSFPSITICNKIYKYMCHPAHKACDYCCRYASKRKMNRMEQLRDQSESSALVSDR